MAYIKVTPKKLDQAAEVIDGYVDIHKNQILKATGAVNDLGTNWEGEDYQATAQKWAQITAEGSTSAQVVTSLQNYADYLRAASEQYKSAQQKAVDRAYKLPTL